MAAAPAAAHCESQTRSPAMLKCSRHAREPAHILFLSCIQGAGMLFVLPLCKTSSTSYVLVQAQALSEQAIPGLGTELWG